MRISIPQLLEDLATANQILANEGVFDGFATSAFVIQTTLKDF